MVDVVPDTLPPDWDGKESGTLTDTSRFFTTNSWYDSQAILFGLPSALDIDQMLPKDGKARNVEQMLTLPLRLASYTIEPGKGDKGEADLVNDALLRPADMGGMRTPMQRLIGQMTAACGYRRSYFERVWTVDDGVARYADVGWRPATSCRPVRDDTGNLNGFEQWVRKGTQIGQWTPIPAGRAFIYTHGTHRNPVDGVSDLDVTWTLYQTKQKIRWLWYSFLENQALPKLVGHVSQSKNDDANAKLGLARQLASLKNGGAVGVGSDEEVQELGAGTSSSFTECLAYLDHEMAGSILAGFSELTSPGRTGGSRALANPMADLYLQGRSAVLDEMAETITHGLIADVVRFNRGPKASVPRFKFGSLTSEDTEQMMALLTAMLGTDKGAALLPDEFISELVMKVAAALNMDADKLAQAVADAQKVAETISATGATPAGQLAAAVGTTAAAAQAAVTGEQPPAGVPAA
jgi:hypothetical protein